MYLRVTTLLVVGIAAHGLAMAQKGLAHGRQRELARGSLQQAHTQPPFQPGHTPTAQRQRGFCLVGWARAAISGNPLAVITPCDVNMRTVGKPAFT